MFSSNTDSLGYQSFKGASWTLVLGLHLGDTIKGLTLILGLLFNPDIWACVLGLRPGPVRLLFQTPSVSYQIS